MSAQAAEVDPVELARHQEQLRRVWDEHGLDPDELESMPFYHGGFGSWDAVRVVGLPWAVAESEAWPVSKIEWTERTWNPVTGCDRTSPGCDNCYALRMAGRLKATGTPEYQCDGDPRTSGPGFGVSMHDHRLADPQMWRDGQMVFVNSMSDMFHPEVTDEFIAHLWDVMRRNPQHTYQILTKRSKRLAAMAPDLPWPEHIWMGVSVETHHYAFRLDHLRQVPAAVRFLSAEPLLGSLTGIDLAGVHWVIVGGESGPGARRMDVQWARDLRDQCLGSMDRPAFFFKQWSGAVKSKYRKLDGVEWNEMPGGPLGPTERAGQMELGL